MQRVYSNEVKPGKDVLLKGWVEKVRNLGNIQFFVLRDREGFVQVTAKKGEVSDDIFKTISDLGREYCVEVQGKVVESKIANVGKEVIPKSVKIVNKAEKPLPLEFSGKIESGKDTRFDYRFLDLRNPEVSKIFWLRHKVIEKIHEFFRKDGFIEVQTPVIQAAGAEGGATMFPVSYYGKNAYLRQSPQLYKQILMASSLDRIYEIGQAFRAEKFHTRRHISEFLGLDFEIAWIESEEDVLNVLERMVVYVLKELKKEVDLQLKIPELPLRRVTYDEALKLLAKAGIEVKWGDDLEDAQESALGDILAKEGCEWYFITKYPSKMKPFYIMQDGKISRGIDLDFRGMELASGGQREHRHDVLVKVMKEKGLNPNDFKFYLDAFRWGMPTHGGIGFGVDRFVAQIAKLPDVQETILFPRTPEKLVP
jgi:aspartyl-tRNA synthetase